MVTLCVSVLLPLNQGALAEYGGHINITRHWTYSLFQNEVCPNKSHFVSKYYNVTNFAEIKRQFLDAVVETVEMEKVLYVCPELILNWDQMGIQIVPSSTWTMDREGVSRIDVVGAKDKRLITAVLCCTLRLPSCEINLQREHKSMSP